MKDKSAIILKLQIHISFHPEILLPRIYLANTLPHVQSDVLTRLFNAALFIMAEGLE